MTISRSSHVSNKRTSVKKSVVKRFSSNVKKSGVKKSKRSSKGRKSGAKKSGAKKSKRSSKGRKSGAKKSGVKKSKRSSKGRKSSGRKSKRSSKGRKSSGKSNRRKTINKHKMRGGFVLPSEYFGGSSGSYHSSGSSALSPCPRQFARSQGVMHKDGAYAGPILHPKQ